MDKTPLVAFRMYLILTQMDQIYSILATSQKYNRFVPEKKKTQKASMVIVKKMYSHQESIES